MFEDSKHCWDPSSQSLLVMKLLCAWTKEVGDCGNGKMLIVKRVSWRFSWVLGTAEVSETVVGCGCKCGTGNKDIIIKYCTP